MNYELFLPTVCRLTSGPMDMLKSQSFLHKSFSQARHLAKFFCYNFTSIHLLAYQGGIVPFPTSGKENLKKSIAKKASGTPSTVLLEQMFLHSCLEDYLFR